MQIPGYEVDGPIGFGADGATWLARDSNGSAVAVRVLGHVPQERHQARLDRLGHLADLDHPHLVALREVVHTSTGRIAVITEAVPGPTLATLRVGRRGLEVAEAIRVGASLASALVALHEAEITHGDLAPANVVLIPGHGAVLVDLAAEPAWEAGTGGFAAPELDDGAIATPASDVYALARLIVWLVAPPERADLEQLLAPALASAPQDRCGAAEVLSILSVHPQASVAVPDLRALAGVSLREHAQRDQTRWKRAQRPRHRRDPNRLPLLAGTLLLVIALAATAAWVWPGALSWGQDGSTRTETDGVDEGGGASGRSGSAHATEGGDDGANITESGSDGGPASRGVVTRDSGSADPVRAIHVLTQQRDVALNNSDAQALAALTIPGSPAAIQDENLQADLVTGALQVQGMHTEIIDAEVIDTEALPDGMPDPVTSSEGPGPDSATWVRAVLHVHEHTRIMDRASVSIPGERTCVLLGLDEHQQRWLVQHVHPC